MFFVHHYFFFFIFSTYFIFFLFFFFFNDTATTEIYTLSLHDALPITSARSPAPPTRLRVFPAPDMTENGVPDCSVTIPASCQPPSTVHFHPARWLKNGNSHTNDSTKRCG